MAVHRQPQAKQVVERYGKWQDCAGIVGQDPECEGRSMKPLTALWNLDFSKPITRRANLRRAIRNRLHMQPKGKGNKAWKRADQLDREPGTIIWPDYALR